MRPRATPDAHAGYAVHGAFAVSKEAPVSIIAGAAVGSERRTHAGGTRTDSGGRRVLLHRGRRRLTIAAIRPTGRRSCHSCQRRCAVAPSPNARRQVGPGAARAPLVQDGLQGAPVIGSAAPGPGRAGGAVPGCCTHWASAHHCLITHRRLVLRQRAQGLRRRARHPPRPSRAKMAPRRLQPVPGGLRLPCLGMQQPVDVQQPRLGIGIGHGPRQRQPLLQAARRRLPLRLGAARSAPAPAAPPPARGASPRAGHARAPAPRVLRPRPPGPAPAAPRPAPAGASSRRIPAGRAGRAAAPAAPWPPRRGPPGCRVPPWWWRPSAAPAGRRSLRPGRGPPGATTLWPARRPRPGQSAPEGSGGRASTRSRSSRRLQARAPGPGRHGRLASPRQARDPAAQRPVKRAARRILQSLGQRQRLVAVGVRPAEPKSPRSAWI